MSCDISKGRKEPCLDVVGGIKAGYMFNRGEYGITYDLTDDHVIDDIDDGAASPSNATCYKWEVKNASDLTQNIQSSRDTGTTFIEQVLSLTLKKLDKDTHKQLMLLAYGRPMIVVHDYNGNAFACGVENGMDVSGGTVVTGAAMGDLSGYTLSLTGHERLPANFLDGATVDDPFAGMSTTVTVVEGT